MIKIIAKRIVPAENMERYETLAREMVERSRAEEGNVAYTFNRSTIDSRIHVFLEEWRDQEALDAHNHSEHFVRLVPQLTELAEEVLPVEWYREITW